MGTTAQKLNRIIQTKEDLAESINYAGGYITDETTFKEYPKKLQKAYVNLINNGTDDLYDALPKTSEEGTFVDLDTEKGKMKININSTALIQNGTPTPVNPQDVHVITGKNSVNIHNKNLFNPSLIREYTHSMGVTISKNNDLITIQGTNDSSSAHAARLIGDNDYVLLKAGVTYTIRYITGQSASASAYRMDMRQYNNAGNIYKYESGTNGMTYTPETDLKVAFYVRLGPNYTINTSGYIQIEIGSRATDYVPYQEQNYPITLSSKNFFDYTQISDAPPLEGFQNSKKLAFKVKPNTKYTLSSNVPQDESTLLYFNGTSTATNGVWLNNPKTMTSDSNGELFVATFTNRPYYNDIINNTYYIQLEEGEIPTSYEPYYNIEYCKIGEYADQIFKNTPDSEFYNNTLVEGDWYLKKLINKYVFENSASDTYTYNTDLADVLPTTLYINGISAISYKKTTSGNWIYSDKFQYEHNTLNEEHFYISSSSKIDDDEYYGNIRLYISHDRLAGYSSSLTNDQKIELVKTWLQNNPTTVYYVTRYPSNIHISEEDYPTLKGELEDIYNNAKSYDNITIINQTNQDLPFNLDISALAKIE